MQRYYKKKRKKYVIIALIVLFLSSISSVLAFSRYSFSVQFRVDMDKDLPNGPYNITYILNGGTQGANAPTQIEENESIQLPTPTKNDYTFGGWYDNENFTGTSISVLSNVTSNITLYAKWISNTINVKYNYGDNIYFDGASFLDSGVAFFSEENKDKHMEVTISLDEVEYLSGQSSGYNTFFSCSDYKTSPWPGFVFRGKTVSGAFKYILKRSGDVDGSRS